MKTNYAGHDTAYQKIRSEGLVGWDRTAEAYRAREAQLRRVLDKGFAPREGRVLELGCGAGNISLWLSKQGYRVHGVDLAPTAIAWAQDKAKQENATATFAVGDVLNLSELPDGSFDFVLDGHCFHCIIGADRSRFLANAWRLLRPGGYLLVDTMCGPVDAKGLEGYDEQSRCVVVRNVASRYFGLPDEIKQSVLDAGFQVLSVGVQKEESHGNMVLEALKKH